LKIGPARILDAIARHNGNAVLALDVEQAIAFGSFPGVRDPMDHMILAAARATGSRLISSDESMDGFGIERVWD
jgi:PIN domain nuclease of toxin-antitoxin system